MANVLKNNGQSFATPANTNANTILLKGAVSNSGDGKSLTGLVQIASSVSGVKFGVGVTDADLANQYAWPSGSKFYITWIEGVLDLKYQKSNNADDFVITV